ncbi:SDR family NAD(P)-dependent oxidoreductase [Paenibacillus riograndensis]|uniref:Short chain dehydrogenase family protein n=1 Tax=Paenibacillus riograndensis SBR5 TaxID=1073571 RepID=A0A0E4H7K8_9BACL|nr:SDR family NAD(P)-dependent oxidoreductase [Paenibacillus riograndensis]CQR53689.1 short chain dehydrogenase family protein [Paenibacillus riograndensis SBR5]
MLNIDFAGKTLVVTGGLTGIGKGITDLFLKAGANVAIGDIACRPGLERIHDRLVQIQMDVTISADAARLIDAAVEAFGGVDFLVNNSGTSTMDYAVDIREEDWDKVMDINAKGVYLVSQAGARQMLRQGRGGRIINIASQAGKNGYRCMGNYVASKHAVLGFTKVMALELAQAQILVNAVCPGIVETDMKRRERVEGAALRGMQPEDILAEDRSQVPLGRTAEPEDVANVVLFLASPLSSYMTGQAINVTGGMTMN